MYVHINMYVHMFICTYGHTYINPLFLGFVFLPVQGLRSAEKRTFVLAGMEQLIIQLILSLICWAPAPRGGVTRQGVVLTDLQSRLDCQ
jgi:hypothetical protein